MMLNQGNRSDMLSRRPGQAEVHRPDQEAVSCQHGHGRLFSNYLG